MHLNFRTYSSVAFAGLLLTGVVIGAGPSAGGAVRQPPATDPLRQRRPHRHAAERAQVLHPPECAAGEARVAAAGGEGRLALRSRRSAGAGAPHRAHGVQRQRALQAGRARARTSSRSARASVRTSTPTPASTKPSTCSTCRPTSRRSSTKGLTALADFAGGLTLDPEEVDKERGVVIEEWRGGLGAGSRIRDKQIPDPVLPLALRRAAADRQAGHHPQRAGRAAARVLRHLVSPGAHGGHRRRRHRPADRSRRRSATPFGAAEATARRRRRRPIASAAPSADAARERHDRSRGDESSVQIAPQAAARRASS